MAQEPSIPEDLRPGGGQGERKQAQTSAVIREAQERRLQSPTVCQSGADTAEVVLGTVFTAVGRTESMCTYELGNKTGVVLRILHVG